MSRALSVSARFFRTRGFSIAIVLWIICSFGIVAFAYESSATSTNSVVSYSLVPKYQVSVLSQENGQNFTVYSQVFNQYGQGQNDWNITLSITTEPFSDKYSLTGLSGTTNLTGLLPLALGSLPYGYYYTIEESLFYPNGTFAFNSTAVINLLTSGHGSLYQNTVSVLPVLSTQNSSAYALHIWKIPAGDPINVTVGYAVSPTLSMAFTSNGGIEATASMANLSLSYVTIVPTHFSVYGHPYFYSVNVTNSTGAYLGGYVFWSTVSPSLQSTHFYNESAGLSSIFIALMSASFVIVLLVYGDTGSKRLSRPFNIRKLKINDGSRSAIFRDVLLAGILVSLPFMAVAVIIPYFMAYNYFHTKVPLFYPFIYLLSLILVSLLAISLVSLFQLSGSPPRFTRVRQRGDMSFKGIMKLLVLLAALFYSIELNLGGILPAVSNSAFKTTVLLNILSNSLNPIGYTWNLGEYLTHNLFLVSYFSFDPGEYFMNAFLLFAIAIAWISVLVILPMFYLRRNNDLVNVEPKE